MDEPFCYLHADMHSTLSIGMIEPDFSKLATEWLRNDGVHAKGLGTGAQTMPGMAFQAASVDKFDVGHIVVGADVQVTLDALSGQHFDGKISALNPFGENSGGNTKYVITVYMRRLWSLPHASARRTYSAPSLRRATRLPRGRPALRSLSPSPCATWTLMRAR